MYTRTVFLGGADGESGRWLKKRCEIGRQNIKREQKGLQNVGKRGWYKRAQSTVMRTKGEMEDVGERSEHGTRQPEVSRDEKRLVFYCSLAEKIDKSQRSWAQDRLEKEEKEKRNLQLTKPPRDPRCSTWLLSEAKPSDGSSSSAGSFALISKKCVYLLSTSQNVYSVRSVNPSCGDHVFVIQPVFVGLVDEL